MTTPITSKYAVIIDAGSSGSRVHVFQWPDSDLMAHSLPKNSPMRSSLPAIKHKPDWSKRISPGVSGFAGNIEGIWPDHLGGLMKFAESIIPEDLHETTPVFFYATAGMRLLDKHTQSEMLRSICQSLLDNTEFYIADCESHVAIIDGETEGLYGWLALNHLTGTLDPTKTKSKSKSTNKPSNSANERVAYGFMDMGGASAQIAFAPNSTEAQRHADDLLKVNLRTLDGNIIDWDVYVGTWLGFGANEARTRLSQLLAMDDFTEDPCLPKGLINEVPAMNGTALVEIHGTGDYEACLTTLHPLLNKHLPCNDDPCLFNGQHAPALDFSTTKFVGVSEYWYMAHDIFQMSGSYDFQEYQEKAQEFCKLSWSEIEQRSQHGDYGKVSLDILRNACFKVSWIMTILHDGFAIPFELDDYQRKKQADLATVTNEDILEAFSGTFNSASHINGVEMSWPLGKAILYASSLVPPSPGTSDIQVGYMPTLLSGKPYVLGGNVLGGSHDKLVDQHAKASAAVKVSMANTNSSHPLLILMVLVILVAFCFSKVRRASMYLWRKNVSPKSSRFMPPPWFKLFGGNSNDGDVRLLEEGFSLKSMKLGGSSGGPRLGRSHTSIPLSQESAAGYYNDTGSDSSRQSLGTSTSMLDLNKGQMISRENSRLNMRPEPPRPLHFDFGEESTR